MNSYGIKNIPCFTQVGGYASWNIQPEGLPYSHITQGTTTSRFHAFSGNLYLGTHNTPEDAARAIIASLRSIDIEGHLFNVDVLIHYPYF